LLLQPSISDPQVVSPWEVLQQEAGYGGDVRGSQSGEEEARTHLRLEKRVQVSPQVGELLLQAREPLQRRLHFPLGGVRERKHLRARRCSCVSHPAQDKHNKRTNNSKRT